MIRAYRGQSSIELVAGLLFLTPIVLAGVDLSTLYMGANMNDQVCRDAARAAAAGPPQSLANGNGPVARAAAVVQNAANRCKGAILIQPHGQVSETLLPPIPQAPYGGPVNGQVTVKTSAVIHPPFMLSFFGMSSVTTNSSHTFAYSYVMPSSIAGSGTGGSGSQGSGGSGSNGSGNGGLSNPGPAGGGSGSNGSGGGSGFVLGGSYSF